MKVSKIGANKLEFAAKRGYFIAVRMANDAGVVLKFDKAVKKVIYDAEFDLYELYNSEENVLAMLPNSENLVYFKELKN